MKILIVGSGGREHALARACSHTKLEHEIACAPGNGGTLRFGRNIPVSAEDVEGLVALVEKEKFDLTIVGPEVPLVGGLANRLMAEGFLVFGPTAEAAQIEGSKAFAKDLMMKAGVPTAQYRVFSELAQAERFINELGAPIVVKASGLAAGKGAVVCQSVQEAVKTARRMLVDHEFGSAGDLVVIEEFLSGVEVSMTAIVDGTNWLLLPPSRDHKAVFDGGCGPNTGGMGAIAPLDKAMNNRYANMARQVIPPILKALAEQGTPFRGFLYPGLMVKGSQFKVLEVNARLGDPEAEVLLPLFGYDFATVALAAAKGSLAEWMKSHSLFTGDWCSVARPGFAATVVAASAGYPGSYARGKVICALPEEKDDLIIFHAGTRQEGDKLVTAGGRVLSVTGLGQNLKSALAIANAGVKLVKFDGIHFRHDIGQSAL